MRMPQGREMEERSGVGAKEFTLWESANGRAPSRTFGLRGKEMYPSEILHTS